MTKADKLTRSEGAKALSIARLQAGGGEAKLFSALKKIGVEETAQLLWHWAHGPEAQALAQAHELTLESNPDASHDSLAAPLPPSESRD